MDNALYEAIFKRKSFHKFQNVGSETLTEDELKDVARAVKAFTPLCPEIKVEAVIEKAVAFGDRGQDAFVLFYSEKKPNYLQNIGYLGEQLDLYLTQKNVGTLWYGFGRPKEKKRGDLDFVIMMAIKKVDSPDKFRKDMFSAARKSVEEIWEGESCFGVANVSRFAPSACNTQPWLIKAEKDGLTVYRFSAKGKHGIMTKEKATYFNQIDIGIYLCVLELCLYHEGLTFERTLYVEEDPRSEKNRTASYRFVT